MGDKQFIKQITSDILEGMQAAQEHLKAKGSNAVIGSEPENVEATLIKCLKCGAYIECPECLEREGEK